jgi:predicted TIM-barrel fold metal-dependent hydrolase
MQRIDCDIHPALPGTAALLPYLDNHWREQVTSRGIDGMDLNSYPLNMPLTSRPDWRVPGAKAGSNLAQMQTQALDAFGLSTAICNCLYGAQAAYDPYMSAAFCGAINEWLTREWLDRDPRLRASIVVPTQNTELAVREIEKRAADRRFVQVLLLSMGETLLGRKQHWPIYEACAKHRLTVGVHPGSSYRQAPTSIGWPSYRYEFYQAEAQVAQSHILSFIYEGVFARFPSLKVVFMESGVSWLPPFMWRAAKTWRGLRVEIPWVDRSPAEIIRDHIRLTVQPFDGPPDQRTLERLLDQIGSDRMLLFASDYPHWQFDGDDPVPAGFAPDLVRRMSVDNPLETYPRLKENVQ